MREAPELGMTAPRVGREGLVHRRSRDDFSESLLHRSVYCGHPHRRTSLLNHPGDPRQNHPLAKLLRVRERHPALGVAIARPRGLGRIDEPPTVQLGLSG